MIPLIPALFAGAIAIGLAIALNGEIRQRMSIQAQLETEQDTHTTLLRDWARQRDTDQQIIHRLSQENRELWTELDTARLERDIRPPADPIVTHLARNGTTHIAELITTFGRQVSVTLAELAHTGHVESDDEHLHWWATPPAETRGRQTRIVKAMAEAHQQPQEPQQQLPAWQHAVTTHDRPTKQLTGLPSASNGSVLTWFTEGTWT